MTSEHLGLGQIIGDPNQQRDAVHIAVIPAVAGFRLSPGDRVEMRDGRAFPVLPGEKWIGVVDPYLSVLVEEGRRFWLFMRPGSITSLRHEWGHPAFPSEMGESEKWLRNFAAKSHVSYDDMLAEIKAGGCVYVGDNDSSYEWRSELLAHAAVVLGVEFTDEQKDEVYFRCSC